MKIFLALLASLLIVQNSVAPPVTHEKKNEVDEKEEAVSYPIIIFSKLFFMF